MLLALNAFKTASSGPTPTGGGTPIGLLLALTRPGVTTTPPAATARTPIGLLLALTRPAIPTVPPIEPPITPPVEVPATSYTGGRAGRGRMIRRRKPGELDLEPPPLSPSPPDLAPPAPGPKPSDLLPPQPGLLAGVAMPQRKPLPPYEDEDEEEVALLLELLS